MRSVLACAYPGCHFWVSIVYKHAQKRVTTKVYTHCSKACSVLCTKSMAPSCITRNTTDTPRSPCPTYLLTPTFPKVSVLDISGRMQALSWRWAGSLIQSSQNLQRQNDSIGHYPNYNLKARWLYTSSTTRETGWVNLNSFLGWTEKNLGEQNLNLWSRVS